MDPQRPLLTSSGNPASSKREKLAESLFRVSRQSTFYHGLLVSKVKVFGKRTHPLPLWMRHVVMTVDGPVYVPPLPMVGITARKLSGPPKVNVGAINEDHSELISKDSGGPDQGQKLCFSNPPESL